MDIWWYAEKVNDRKELELAWSLGFDYCQQCGEWFHQNSDEWLDCVECGRHCPSCAETVDWEWCAECGLYYCQRCRGDADELVCDVCAIEA